MKRAYIRPVPIGTAVAVAQWTASGIRIHHGRLVKMTNPLFGSPTVVIRQGTSVNPLSGTICFRSVTLRKVIALQKIPS
ncbi:hypothetical protein [Cohnella caldifontis]|uniref:hypothetical protein n=1 Tax=Cohnella caldifontis TaxID=3027471 RepID=UPI0023ED5F89|nr:hypothetical protein [Cohnella sp. YIM B05605]